MKRVNDWQTFGLLLVLAALVIAAAAVFGMAVRVFLWSSGIAA